MCCRNMEAHEKTQSMLNFFTPAERLADKKAMDLPALQQHLKELETKKDNNVLGKEIKFS